MNRRRNHAKLNDRWRSDLDLPADLYKARGRKIEAVRGMDRVEIEQREQPPPPSGKPRLLLASDHMVTLAEKQRGVGIERTIGFCPVQGGGNVGIFKKAEMNGDVPKTFTKAFDTQPVFGPYPRSAPKTDRQRDRFFVERAHLANVIGDQGRHDVAESREKDRLAGHTPDLAFAQLPHELGHGQRVALLTAVHGVDS